MYYKEMMAKKENIAAVGKHSKYFLIGHRIAPRALL